MFKKLKQKYCKHEFHSFDDERYTGDCLSWGLRVVNGYQSTYKCNKCGKQEIRRYYYFNNIKNPDGSYNFG